MTSSNNLTRRNRYLSPKICGPEKVAFRREKPRSYFWR